MASMIESVEYVEVAFAGTDLVKSFSLTKGQNYTKCVPFMTSHSESTYHDCKLFDVYFSSGTITFERYTQRANTATIKCYVVEFNSSEVRVQQGSFNVDTASTDTVTLGTTLNSVNKAAMTFAWKANYVSRPNHAVFVRGQVLSTTSIDFYRYSTTSSCSGHWFLFEDLNENFKVTHKASSSASASRYVTIDNGNCVDPLRTFILSSYASASSSNYPSRGTTSTYLFSDGAVKNDKTDATYYNVYLNCQIVEFLDEDKIYVPFDHMQQSLINTATLVRSTGGTDTTVPWTVNSDSTAVVTGMMQGISQCTTTAYQAINGTFISAELTASGTISFEKIGNTYTYYPSYTVAVDWEGIDIDVGTNDSPIIEGTGEGESFVKSVENFRFTLSDKFGARVLTKGQEWENCAIFSSHRCSTGDYPDYHTTNVYLVTPGIVCFKRYQTTGDVYIDVSVVEFHPDQVKVQHKNIATLNNTTTNVDIEAVSNVNKSFILSKVFNSYHGRTINRFPARVSFTTTSGIEIYKHTASYSDVSIFVVEDLQDNFKTKHFTDSFTNGTDYIYDDTDVWNSHTSFPIVSYATNCADNRPSRSSIRARWMYEFNPLRMDKADTAYYYIYWTGTLVKFLHSKRYVENIQQDLITSNSVVSYNYIEDFINDSHALTCFNNVMSSNIKCTTTAYQGISETFGTIRITDYDAGTCEISKSGTSYSSYGTFVLLDWIGASTSGTIDETTPTKSIVNSVQVDTYYNSDKLITVPLTKGQNSAQCVPFVSNSGHASTFEITTFYKGVYRYEDYFQLDYTGDNTGDRYVSCSIVEFGPDITVQYGGGYSSTTTKTFTIEEVNLDRAFLVFYAHSDSWNNYLSSISVCGHFTSSTELEFIRAIDNNTMYISWYIVECPNDDNYWKVQHVYETSKGGAANVYATPNHTINPNRSIMLGSWTTTCVSDYPSRQLYKMSHSLKNQFHFSKTDGTHYNMNNVNVEVVEMSPYLIDKGFKTIFGEVTLNASTTSFDFDLNLPVNDKLDLSRSFVVSGNQHSEGTCTTTAKHGLQEGYHHYEFKDDDTVTAMKTGSTSSYSTSSVFYAYQFPEYNKYYMEGYVTEMGTPVSRQVYAYRTSTGRLVDTSTSNSGTGYFFVETPYPDEHMVVCLDDVGGYDYNYQIYGKMYPAVISGTFAYNEGQVTTSGLDIGVPLGRQ